MLAQLLRAIRARLSPTPPRYGVTPWGEPTGLRVSPLSAAETAAAQRAERAALDTLL